MPYMRLSTYSPRRTFLRVSPIPGLSWRQWKACRAWIKRRKASPAAKKAWMNDHDKMHRLARVIAPSKHNWIA